MSQMPGKAVDRHYRGGLVLLAMAMAIAVVLVASIVNPAPAEARSLMPFFEQESWLAYAVFAPERGSAIMEKVIRIRDDNCRFAEIDPSFAIRTVLADWIIAEYLAGNCAGPLFADDAGVSNASSQNSDAPDAAEVALLEVLAREVRATVRLIPQDALYRMPVLMLTESGVAVLKQLLPALRNELPISAIATKRWNNRLPLAAVDIAANAIAPYVIRAQSHGTLLEFRELSGDRHMALGIAERIMGLSKTAAAVADDIAPTSFRKADSCTDLTEALLKVVMTGQ
mgnify:FL=1